MSALPNYLPRPCRQFFPLPYTLRNAQMLGLLLKAADAPTLAANFIDPVLNEAAGAPGRFIPGFGSYFLMAYIHYPLLTQSGAEFGGFSYQESVLYLPIKDTRPAPGEPSTYWFTPVVVLDSFLPLIAGREIYGFPKLLGSLTSSVALDTLFNAATPAATGAVQTQGFATTAKTEIAGLQPVWSWDITGQPGSLFENLLGHAVNDFLSLHLPGFGAVEKDLLQFVGKLVPGLFLKEFPAAQDPSLAVYRQLVRCAFDPTAVHRLRLLSGEATFGNPASFPVADQLGLPPNQAVSAELAFLMEMDWVIPGGSEMP